MEKKHKQLIITDVCARLPYGLFVHENREQMDDQPVIYTYDYHPYIDNCLPYLRPLSSMTEDEKKVYHKLLQMSVTVVEPNSVRKVPMYIVDLEDDGDGLNHLYDWFNENHFDYRGLIPMGLALEAPENMYKVEDHGEN